ncbi:glycosyltransferase family 4 protein [Methylobacter luteus]|uniref:glycosyltransferase family 4 protein n=1 Tax=Methylobacter luteus TaxID=415 RepID=UPI0003FF6486|nr:glycosyltransferase family 1 protein [Methylobacter luteus]
MKIIVINALSALRGGGQTYLINLLSYLPEGDFKVLLLVNSQNKQLFSQYSSDRIELFEAVWASKSILHRTMWERITLPFKLKEWRATIYYAPGGVMITTAPKGCLSATALRNMLPFDDRERKRFPLISIIRFKLWLLRFVFLKSYQKSDRVVFISEYSMSVIKQYMPDIENKGVVVPHGLNSRFLNAEDSYDLPDILKPNQFYLYVSILDVYKAQKEIVKTWRKLLDNNFPYPLVLAGPKYNQYGEETMALIDQLGLADKVIYLGKVDYEKLPSLYKSARVLLFASSCECCPNILLEKLAAGKPVLCSNIEPMPEFGGDAVVYFDPYEPADLCEKIMSTETDASMMNEMADRAYKQALKFDWSNTAQKTIDFLIKNN